MGDDGGGEVTGWVMVEVVIVTGWVMVEVVK